MPRLSSPIPNAGGGHEGSRFSPRLDLTGESRKLEPLLHKYMSLIIEQPTPQRALREEFLSADLTVVGGGMAGVCAAIAAARAGLKVVLFQDRPVLGGNASSEVRLWVLGATTHMGSNNRWAREGGVIDEILLENLWRNREGNPVLFDVLLLEKATAQKNLTVLLNTAVFECGKVPGRPDRIAWVRGFNSQNSTFYRCSAPLFCDASGDGLLGFMAGAAFRMGAESREEFGEGFAPTGDFGHLLGHSIYFYSRDTGQPVTYVPPSFALSDVPGSIPRHRAFNTRDHGCRLWWIEYGGRLDTVHQTEQIKWELWRVVYGVWNYIKNSGLFPEASHLTLEWVGQIPGKRESRRFEGDYLLRQQDIVERRRFEDGVAFGGWSIDLHPADGVYAEIAGSHHLHSKGIYEIPYRCYYSRNLDNLFLAGRNISTTHVAYGSTRVMATCAHGAQAVAEAAALCRENNQLPRDLLAPALMAELRRRLWRQGQHIPGYAAADPEDLALTATRQASSCLTLSALPANGPWLELNRAQAQMIPLPAGPTPAFTLTVRVDRPARLELELWRPSDPGHHTPDVRLESAGFDLEPAASGTVRWTPQTRLENPGCVFLIVRPSSGVALGLSEWRITGLLRLAEITLVDYRPVGGEAYAIYTPGRRPGGQNMALSLDPSLSVWDADQVAGAMQRPTAQPNAWVADPADAEPWLTLNWNNCQTIGEVVLHLDGDFDHALESVLFGHPERAVPFCLRHFRLEDAAGCLLAEERDWHLSRWSWKPAQPLSTRGLRLRILATWGAPATVFQWRVYGPQAV